MLIKKLARVSKATLVIKERGILNFWVHVDYEEGFSQGIGGIALDSYDEQLKHRVGTAYGCEMIRKTLEVFDVNDFSEMKGKMIYVLGYGEGFSFTPCGFEKINLNKNHNLVMFATLKTSIINLLWNIHEKHIRQLHPIPTKRQRLHCPQKLERESRGCL